MTQKSLAINHILHCERINIMRSLISAGCFIFIMLFLIIINSYYVNKSSTELLDMIYSLPSDAGDLNNADAAEFLAFRVRINEIVTAWEKFERHLKFVARYSDYEKIHTALLSLRDCFESGDAGGYLSARSKLITALERQKSNELPSLDNIL